MTAIGAFVAVIALTACGGGASEGPSTPEPAHVTSGGITLAAPQGWSVRTLPDNGGLVFTAARHDLFAVAPDGARLTATSVRLPFAVAAADAYATGEHESHGAAVTRKTVIDQRKSVVIDWAVGSGAARRRSRVVLVDVGTARVVRLEMQGPQTDWTDSVRALGTMISAAKFDVGGAQD
jgi:hypothetical protein